METITIEYDATNPALRGLLLAFLKLDGVKKVKTKKAADTKKPEYDLEMVAKVKRGQEAFRRGDYKIIKTDDLWK